jgi:hypothetical protein
MHPARYYLPELAGPRQAPNEMRMTAFGVFNDPLVAEAEARKLLFNSLNANRGPMRICFLGSRMNAIGRFSAPLNGFRRGHPTRMSSRQKQETPRHGLNRTHPTHSMTDVDAGP